MNTILRIIYVILSPFAYLVYGGKTYEFAFDLLYYLSPKKYRNFVRLLWSQANQETGKFQSDLFKRSKNMFGMNVPSKRKFYGYKEEGQHYAYYHTYMDSILDVVEWYMMYDSFKRDKIEPIVVVNWLFEKKYFTGNPIVYAKNVSVYYNAKIFSPTSMILTLPLPLILLYILVAKKK